MGMEKLQAANNFGTVKTGSVFNEFPFFLNVEHQITTIEVFHHEEKMTLQNFIKMMMKMLEAIDKIWYRLKIRYPSNKKAVEFS